MGSRNAWPAMIAGALIPGLTAALFAAFALEPQRFPEEFVLPLALLFAADALVCMLGPLLLDLLFIKGSAIRRGLLHLGVVIALGVPAAAGLWVFDAPWVAIVAWSLLGNLASVFFLSPEVPMARARLDAIVADTTKLWVIWIIVIAMAALGGFALSVTAGDMPTRLHITLQWSDLAWVAGAYFVLRALSVVWDCSAAYARNEKGFLDRPWINWIIAYLGRYRGVGDS
jgi:hypothetical protein